MQKKGRTPTMYTQIKAESLTRFHSSMTLLLARENYLNVLFRINSKFRLRPCRLPAEDLLPSFSVLKLLLLSLPPILSSWLQKP